jgi:hypothetical protein
MGVEQTLKRVVGRAMNHKVSGDKGALVISVQAVIGLSELNSRIHVCWIQCGRSLKRGQSLLIPAQAKFAEAEISI